jgi:predicted Kef-type K+ transport protein
LERLGDSLVLRDFFAVLCFISFGIALWTQSIYAFTAAVMFGFLSRVAKWKDWPAPEWVAKLIFFREK